MFRFPLQPVLEHREHLEQEARRRVADAHRALLALDEAIGQTQSERADLGRAWRQEATEGMVPARQEIYSGWDFELIRRRQALANRRQEVERRLSELRGDLEHAHREMRKVEKLRERAQEQHRRHVESLEAKAADDLTVMRHGRQPVGGR